MAEFSNAVKLLAKGQVETELSTLLKALVAAVRDTGKSGKLSLTLDIAKDKRDQRLLRFSTDIKIKMPEIPPPATFFSCHENRLIDCDDVQRQLEFGPSDSSNHPCIEINPDQGDNA